MSLRIQCLLLAVLGGSLSIAAWPPSPAFPLIFIAWVPLLLIQHLLDRSETKRPYWAYFGYVFLFFIIWNVGTTWWVKNASPGGSLAAFFFNSLFMSVPLLLFQRCRRRLGDSLGYLSLFAFWLSFEYLHQVWEISWPWLTLGNVFAMATPLVQWYELTGNSGGTLWVLLINYLIFRAVTKVSSNAGDVFAKNNIFRVFYFLLQTNFKTILVFSIPAIYSLILYVSYEEQGEPVDVVVLQPNIDPYEKFDRSKKREHTDKFIRLSVDSLDQTVDYLVWPETSLPQAVWLDDSFERTYPIGQLRQLLNRYPDLTVVTGVTSLQWYETKESLTARPYRGRRGGYYDVYNSAIELNGQTDDYELYVKSKLVPGVEKMPYPALFGFLEHFAIDLGGIAGSLGSQPERSVFTSSDRVKVAPVICYESVYADYVTGYIRKGAQLIFIVTNDAWWGFTPGHKQHLHYARLRAIENRRSIARSANTGISCFIDQRGNLSQATAYNEDAVIRQTILANDKLTFFSNNGDILSRGMLFMAAFCLLNLIVSSFTQNFRLSPAKRRAKKID